MDIIFSLCAAAAAADTRDCEERAHKQAQEAHAAYKKMMVSTAKHAAAIGIVKQYSVCVSLR